MAEPAHEAINLLRFTGWLIYRMFSETFEALGFLVIIHSVYPILSFKLFMQLFRY